jgi:hypothetical protein
MPRSTLQVPSGHAGFGVGGVVVQGAAGECFLVASIIRTESMDDRSAGSWAIAGGGSLP